MALFHKQVVAPANVTTSQLVAAARAAHAATLSWLDRLREEYVTAIVFANQAEYVLRMATARNDRLSMGSAELLVASAKRSLAIAEREYFSHGGKPL